MEKYYTASGTVEGKMWGSGVGQYPAEQHGAKTLPALRSKIKKELKSGALDSGFGFEYLIKAEMTIVTTITIEKDGEIYTRTESREETYEI